jgi:hypothetical protein
VRHELEAELGAQPADRRVLRGDELAATLDDRAVRQRVRSGAPADALARLEHGHAVAVALEPPGGVETGEPGAHDDDVH